MLMLKTFMLILTIDFMNPIVHDLQFFLIFKFWIRRDRLHVLYLWYLCFMYCSFLIIHPHIGKHGLEAITVVSGGMLNSRSGFYLVTKLTFIHPTTNLYATWAPKTLLCILTIDSIHPVGHHMPWFKFQFSKKTRSSLYFTLAVSMFYGLFPC
jgi:hypothetical protein